MTRTFKGLLVLSAAAFLTGCLQEESMPSADDKAYSLLVTKSANTSEDAQEGNLLLLLD